MVELNDLRSLVEVIETGGFGRAAKRLGIAKSLISRRIARIEAELGIPLLNRTTRGISPTEAGLELKVRGERILAEVEDAREALAGGSNGVVGRLRLSVPLFFGTRYVTPVLADLARRHPKLEMDISYSNRLVDLIGERFDAAIRIGVLEDSSLVARRIAPVHTVLVASPEYLDRHGRPITPDDLVSHECLSNPLAQSWVFEADKRSISIRPQGRLRSDSGQAIVHWAIEGLGIGAAPSFVVSDAIESGRLEPLLLEYTMPGGGVHVVRPPGRYVPSKVRVLIDALVERFGGQPVWERWLMDGRRSVPG